MEATKPSVLDNYWSSVGENDFHGHGQENQNSTTTSPQDSARMRDEQGVSSKKALFHPSEEGKIGYHYPHHSQLQLALEMSRVSRPGRNGSCWHYLWQLEGEQTSVSPQRVNGQASGKETKLDWEQATVSLQSAMVQACSIKSDPVF